MRAQLTLVNNIIYGLKKAAYLEHTESLLTKYGRLYHETYIKFLLHFCRHFLVCFTMEQTWPNLFMSNRHLLNMDTQLYTFFCIGLMTFLPLTH